MRAHVRTIEQPVRAHTHTHESECQRILIADGWASKQNQTNEYLCHFTSAESPERYARQPGDMCSIEILGNIRYRRQKDSWTLKLGILRLTRTQDIRNTQHTSHARPRTYGRTHWPQTNWFKHSAWCSHCRRACSSLNRVWMAGIGAAFTIYFVFCADTHTFFFDFRTSAVFVICILCYTYKHTCLFAALVHSIVVVIAWSIYNWSEPCASNLLCNEIYSIWLGPFHFTWQPFKSTKGDWLFNSCIEVIFALHFGSSYCAYKVHKKSDSCVCS